MRRHFILILWIVVLGLQPVFASLIPPVMAQAPGPGGGHGYLIDKHAAASLGCSACHRDAPPPRTPEMPACLRCHDSYGQLAAKTAADRPNPHASHLGEVPCSACHHVHKESELVCKSCHNFNMKPPP
jgi:hypothetical protein